MTEAAPLTTRERHAALAAITTLADMVANRMGSERAEAEVRKFAAEYAAQICYAPPEAWMFLPCREYSALVNDRNAARAMVSVTQDAAKSVAAKLEQCHRQMAEAGAAAVAERQRYETELAEARAKLEEALTEVARFKDKAERATEALNRVQRNRRNRP